MVDLHGFKGELGLADLRLHLFDEGDHLLHLGKALHDGFQHGVIVYLIGAGFDHADLFSGAGNGKLQVALLALLGVGGQNDLTIDQTDIDAGDGLVPRNIGNRQCHGSADHTGDLGYAVGVNGKNCHHNGNIVAHILGEQRANGAVYHTAGKNSLIAGTTLTLEEGAGNLAHSVQLFLKVYGKRQKVDAVTRLGRGSRIDQNRRLAIAHQYRAARLTAHLAGLKAHLASGKFCFKYAEIFKHLFSPYFMSFVRLGSAFVLAIKPSSAQGKTFLRGNDSLLNPRGGRCRSFL